MPRRFNSEAREHILETATGLFASKGYKAVSMEEIAVASGVKKANLFYYYPTKETLAVAVQQFVREKLRLWVTEGFPSDSDDPIGDVSAFFSQIGDPTIGNPTFRAGLGGEMATSSEVLRLQVSQTINVWIEWVTNSLDRAHSRGYFNHDFCAKNMAKVLAALAEGATLQSEITGKPDALRAASEAAKMLLLNSRNPSMIR